MCLQNFSLQDFKESILIGHEIELTICDTPFFIGSAGSGTPQCVPHTVYNEKTKELFRFLSREDLWNCFRFRGQSMEELWDDIEIKFIY